MIQLVEVGSANSKFGDTHGRPRQLGAGQTIEREMAMDLGVKIFKVYAPIRNRGNPQFEREVDFTMGDIKRVVHQIKEWYEGGCTDKKECTVGMVRSRMERDGSNVDQPETDQQWGKQHQDSSSNKKTYASVASGSSKRRHQQRRRRSSRRGGKK